MTSEQLNYKGELKGHAGWVTSLCTSAETPNKLLSGSRDKTIILWQLKQQTGDSDQYGTMEKRLTGHHHFVEDIDMSSDAQYALSCSWDNSIRLWNLSTGETHKQFKNEHKKDILSVSFSPDNRQIISSGRDRTIKLWNTIGQCKYTFTETEYGHNDWVTCVRFSPNSQGESIAVSAGMDHCVRVWQISRQVVGHETPPSCKFVLKGHTLGVNAVSISPDGSLCASGGKDGVCKLWDLNEGKPLSDLGGSKQAEAAEVNAIAFSPNRYWLCAAVNSSIKIWDLESKGVVDTLNPFENQQQEEQAGGRIKKSVPIRCISLAWSADGSTLFAGYTDKIIRVWVIS